MSESYELIENNDLDIIIGGYNEIKDNSIVKTRVSLSGLHIYEKETISNFMHKLLTRKTTKDNREIGDCPTGRIYNRLFKRTSISDLRFNTSVHISEDTLFMIDYVKQVKRIGVIDRVWYNYYINEYSITNDYNRKKLINNIKVFINEIEKRKKIETDLLLKNAYQARIDKATAYMNKIKNSNK